METALENELYHKLLESSARLIHPQNAAPAAWPRCLLASVEARPHGLGVDKAMPQK